MTQVDVVYKYGAAPSEAAALGLARLREVYGIRALHFSEAEKDGPRRVRFHPPHRAGYPPASAPRRPRRRRTGTALHHPTTARASCPRRSSRLDWIIDPEVPCPTPETWNSNPHSTSRRRICPHLPAHPWPLHRPRSYTRQPSSSHRTHHRCSGKRCSTCSPKPDPCRRPEPPVLPPRPAPGSASCLLPESPQLQRARSQPEPVWEPALPPA